MNKNYIKILIVDDEESLCELYLHELTEEGYEVVTTTNGKEAMQAIQKHIPDVVVLDIRIGDTDGLDLLQRIRHRYRDMPVILNSAYSRYKDDLRSIAADYYVVKSADLTELKTKIGRAIEGSPQYELHFDTMLMEGAAREPIRHSVS